MPVRKQGSAIQNDQPFVSVIIPIYNAAEFIIDTLKSIQNQTLRSIEIICIDDCSSDQSLSLVRHAQQDDDRIIIVSNNVNKGAGAAINQGLEIAAGNYIQIIGNDDYLDPKALEFLFQHCEQNNLDFCQYGVNILINNSEDPVLESRGLAMQKYHRIDHTYPIASGVDLLPILWENDEYRMTNGPQIIKRSLIHDNGIRNLEGVHHEDMYFTYRTFLCARRATLLDKPLYSYRIRKGSVEFDKNERSRTANEFYSLLHNACSMIIATPEKLFQDPHFRPVIERYIFSHLKTASRQYASLNNKELEKIPLPSTTVEAAVLKVLETKGSCKLKTIASNFLKRFH